MLDWSEDLKTEVIKLESGATVIDCGVKQKVDMKPACTLQDSA